MNAPRIRAGAISEGTASARRINKHVPLTDDPYNLHKAQRVDAAYLTDSHARMVAGNFEQRPAKQPAMPVQFAGEEPEEFQGRDANDVPWLSARDLVFVVAAIAVIAVAVRVFY
jgi:hypothetical protein